MKKPSRDSGVGLWAEQSAKDREAILTKAMQRLWAVPGAKDREAILTK